MLTQVELGQANPSIATIDAIAHSLDVDLVALMLETVPASSGESIGASTIWTSPAGSEAVLLTATAHIPRAELWWWRLEPGDRYSANPDRPGTEELFHVHAGHLTIRTQEDVQTLRPGEARCFASSQFYTYMNEGLQSVFFTRVVVGA